MSFQSFLQGLFVGLSLSLSLWLSSKVHSGSCSGSWLESTVSLSATAQSLPVALQSHHEEVCGSNRTANSKIWRDLCAVGLVESLDHELYETSRNVHIIQIGAHVGFELNDPLAAGMYSYLQQVPPQLRKSRIHWTFVEPSPPNFKRLQQNLAERPNLCGLHAINAGIVPESNSTLTQESNMVFYSISESIDPVTGYDSVSGQTFPHWVTQLSSFSTKPITHNRMEWKKRGLDINDYIVKSKVPTKTYSRLVQEIMTGQSMQQHRPILVLIDTEGFDCKIILGITKSLPFWPKYLVFEHKQCADSRQTTNEYLISLGYTVQQLDNENTLASRS